MSRRRPIPAWAELPLVAVDLAVAIAFCRVFRGWSFLGPLVAFVLLGHAAAIATRRRLPGPAAPVVAIVGGVLAATWILFPSTTWLGLPTSATWQAAGDALSVARQAYPVVVAPTRALTGFLLAGGLALWLSAWFGDWTAHRLHATAEAVTTPAAIFAFCAVLGSGRHQVASAAAFVSTVLLFAASQRAASVVREQPWLPKAPATARAIFAGGLAVALVATAGAVAIGPRLPGAGEPPVVHWRGHGGGGDTNRVTVSPMVQLKRRLVQQSDQIVFTVRSTQRAYWRLTSLDRFDGDIWSSSGNFTPAGDQLPGSGQGGRGTEITQRFEIDALSTIWAPAAFEPTSVRRSSGDLRWDRRSSTLIVSSGRTTSDGLAYTVVSRTPSIAPEELRRATGRDLTTISSRYEALPARFPSSVASLARRITTGASSRYDAALALQEWFRQEFSYSLDAPPGHGDDALVAFLESRVGYCEQFAGAFAAMARSLGMPARVAVGFTPGQQSPTDPTRYTVRGRHAHAWPEVWFPKVGWVAFEPTPGRGIPGAEQYTGVPDAQDQTATVSVVPSSTAPDQTSAATTATTPERATTAPTDGQVQAGAEPSPAEGRGPEGQGRRWLLLLALAAGAIAAVATARVRARRRAARSLAGRSPVERRWQEVLDHLASTRDLRPGPADTPIEWAERTAAQHPDLAPALADLARALTEDRWSAAGTTPELEARAGALATELLAVPALVPA